MDSSSEIVIATYNVLADAYVRPEFFPRCDPAHLAAAARYPRLVERAVALDADVVCLQEVDARLHAMLDARLSPLGYRGEYAQKGEGKPDGCSTFVRCPWTVAGTHVLAYADGGGKNGRSGHVALIQGLACGKRRLTVTNTHIKWDAPEAPERKRVGYAQARELAALLAWSSAPRIVCGDFNAELGGPILNEFTAVGFADAHRPFARTNNAGDVARKIDFILHAGGLKARPRPTTSVEDRTALPNDVEPSDHVPLVTGFRFP